MPRPRDIRRGPPQGGSPHVKPFTEAELRRIQKMAFYGASNREIAARLDIDESTLRDQIARGFPAGVTILKARSRLRSAARRKLLKIYFNDKHPNQGKALGLVAKGLLGMSEKITVRSKHKTTVEVSVSAAELSERVELVQRHLLTQLKALPSPNDEKVAS